MARALDVKLLAVSYAYPPLRYPRAIQVARLLAHLQDAHVTVVAAEEDEAEERDTALLDAYPDGPVHVVRVPWSGRSRLLALGRRERLDRHLVPDRFRPWHRDAVAAIHRLDLLRDVDLLITFGQPMSDHLIGLALARNRRLPWVVHLSDPWSDNPFTSRSPLAAALDRRLEAAVLTKASLIVVTNAEAREALARRIQPDVSSRIRVLPHAFDPRLYPTPVQRSGQLCVRYIGSLYGPRSPTPLLDAVDVLRRQQEFEDVRIELVGPTTHEFDNPFVATKPPVSYLDSLGLMRASDLLLNLEAPGAQTPFLPSKLVDYLGARVPIAAIAPEGSGSSLVRKVGGWQADPRAPTEVAAMLGEALTQARRARGSAVWGEERTVHAYRADEVAAEARELFADAVSLA